ncbi:hypothetical protein DYB36_013468 [Aphanomyces astaci]|uniref:Uncharacterized protein n=1 Tax=Aphanomyces astaci TaxID=112090 RepID=A0A396ZWR6_APHAT|nr:hypothetical protein DYB36_013468 [Aphanomyces astaci]
MRGKRGNNLTSMDRNAILHRLLALVTPQSTLPRGAFTAIAVDFDVARSTVRHVWLRAAVNLEDKRRPCSDVSSCINGHCGRNLKYANVASRMKVVPKSKRTTFGSIAAALNMPRSTLHDYYKRGDFVKYSSSWFFGTSVKKTYYLAPGEETPHRTCKSKHFINKVMFLLAVARPRWDREERVVRREDRYMALHGEGPYRLWQSQPTCWYHADPTFNVKLAARGRLPEIVVAERDVINNGLALLSATDIDSKIDEHAQKTALAIELSEFCSQLELLVVRSDPEADDDVDETMTPTT